MKNLKIFAVALIAALFTFGFASCTDDNDPLAGNTYELSSYTVNGEDVTAMMEELMGGLPKMTIKFGKANDAYVTMSFDDVEPEELKGTYYYDTKAKKVSITIEGETMDFDVSDNGKKISITQEEEGMNIVMGLSRK